MATATKSKPASKKGKPAAKPATKKPATKEAKVTVQAIAKKVDRTPRSVRVSIRKLLGDGKAVVGKGKRYGWPSWSHPEVKKILSALSTSE